MLKGITVAGAGATVWTKPVVDAVMLPAHGGTTTLCGTCVAYEDYWIGVPEGQATYANLYRYDNAQCSGVGVIEEICGEGCTYSFYCPHPDEIPDGCFGVRDTDEWVIYGCGDCPC